MPLPPPKKVYPPHSHLLKVFELLDQAIEKQSLVTTKPNAFDIKVEAIYYGTLSGAEVAEIKQVYLAAGWRQVVFTQPPRGGTLFSLSA